ncbi:echinoderm microtubule-associated protein-like 4 [Sinocyclocheilus grahami]|uniref:echinoderm microtubule-associated protein-like 4 n=1 Tax=Sinocyclocheilus grahami TaxID=75366 RepID=UPI0007ACBB12|nr:PREDICTED: echinoderm microtubule-associated protein-like 4 [Sinocyclocheilus grahami]
MEDNTTGLAPVCSSTATLNHHCTDDSISAASTSDVQDRLSSLELRVQQQEDELTVMKAALADVLRRLAQSEDAAAAAKKQQSSKGQTPLREAYSMSCIANGSSSVRKSHRDSSTVSIAKKGTLSSAAKSGGERKKDKPPMEGIKEKEEPPQANDKTPSAPSTPQAPSPSSNPPSPHPPLPQRQLSENKGSTLAKSRGSSAKRGGMERSQSSTWDSGEENRNKLVKAASTSKLLSKVVKNAEKHRDPVISQAKMSTREKNSQEGEYIKMFMRGRPITMFIPSDVENYDDVRTELPPERLKLEWVYGYRGRDCRANVYLLPTGEIVYFIASVVVLFNYEERTQRHYLGHTDCVKCLAVHPDKIRIATGQIAGVDKDGRPLQPHVRVWDSVSLSTLQIIGLGTFERGVGSLAFSKADSGIHLSVIDDSNEHMLTVWDWQKKSKIAEIKTTNEVVLAVEFHPTDANTIVTCGKSHIFFWTWSGSSLARKQGIFGKLCASGSPSVLLTHPIPTGAFQITRQIKAHDGSVFTLCQMRNGTLLTGGGKDHKIILWDHDLNPERDIEVPDQYGTIRAVAEGKGEQFLVGTSRNFILRGTFNDGFQVEVQGHTDELWGLAAHPFKDLFLTCAQDRQVCLWNSVYHTLEWTRLLDIRAALMFSFSFFIVKSFNLRLQGHSSYITHLDWSPDNKFIMSNSGDYEILYWDIPNGCKLIRNRSECKDIDWATYTCVLGFHVFGVWPEGSDGTDINALVRSHNRKVIALADDFCKVHLFQYPCSRPKAPSHKYSAHSSHVTNVSFMHSDSNLISTGGKDMSIMQWRLVEKTSSLVHSDSSLGLGDSLLHNSTPRTLASVPSVPHTPTEPMPVPASLPISSQPNTNTPPLTPPEPLHTVTPNGQQDGSPETPPPSDEATPTSDSTLSPKDSLEPSDDTATPSDEGTTFNPPL